MPLNTSNHRIHKVYRELGSIVDDPGMAARLPQALLDTLNDMRGMLREELHHYPEADSESDVFAAGAQRA
jgi:hypothetical protein